jgi:hypothetical protein
MILIISVFTVCSYLTMWERLGFRLRFKICDVIAEGSLRFLVALRNTEKRCGKGRMIAGFWGKWRAEHKHSHSQNG